jgi:hypothetical protein
MNTTRSDQLIEQYLERLAEAAAALPAGERDDLIGDIREHISVALEEEERSDEVAVRNVLARLGPPEAIVAAAGATDRPALLATAPDGSTRGGPLEWSALILLLVSGYLMPPLGWMIGALLVVCSRQWSRREKLTGIVGIPLATLVVTAGLGYLSVAILNVGDLNVVGLAIVTMGPAGVLYLLWRLDARLRTRRRLLA